MVQVNGYTTVDRHNRPSVNSAVLLRAYFINNGAFQDPVDISSVTVFRATTNQSPSSLLDTNGLLDATSVSSNVLMAFDASATHSGNAALPVSDYTPGVAASGVYKLSTGEYAVILNGTVNLSGNLSSITGSSTEVANGASSVGDYLDVWTVKLTAGSDYKTVIQEFSLYDDTFFTVSQPIMFSVRSKINNKRVVYGSKIDLVIGNEVSVDNKDIGSDIKNLFCNSVLTDAGISITKLNDTNDLASRFEVSGFSDTSSTVDVTSDNSILFNWDTTSLAAIAAANEDFGGIKGTYEVRGQFNILNQRIKTQPLFMVIR